MPDHTSPDLLLPIPSIPASQALRTQSSSSQHALLPSQSVGCVSTGLAGLDDAISAGKAVAAGEGRERGFARGSVSEVYGPPGVGKTLLLLNTAVKALAAGQHIVWIDTSSPLPKPRLFKLLNTNTTNQDTEGKIQNLLTHIRTPSLPHLLALLTHPPLPTASFPPSGTSLMVVDSVSAPFQSYFPHATEIRTRFTAQTSSTGGNTASSKQDQHTHFLLNRKRSIAGSLASAVSKLASAHNIAVVLINQTHTKIRGLPKPTLFPALATGGAWEMAVGTRIVLYRDFDGKEKVRWAEMMKKNGKVLGARSEGDVVRFVVGDDGLREVQPQAQAVSLPVSVSVSVSVRKRKVGEIADSEEEEEEEEEFEDEFGEEEAYIDS